MRINPVLRAQVRDTAAHPARMWLTSLAVVIATAFGLASVITTGSLRLAALDQFSGTPATVDVQVRPERGVDAAAPPLAGPVSAVIGEVPGVRVHAVEYTAELWPVEDGRTAVLVRPDAASAPLWLSSAPLGELSGAQLTAGRAPAATGEIALPEQLAGGRGVAVGDTLWLAALNHAPVRLTVVGLTDLADNTTMATPATVRSALGADGWTHVLIGGESGIEQAELAERVTAALAARGWGLQVRTGAQFRTAELAAVANSADQVLFGLLLFVLVAAVAAALVVTLTFRIVFAQEMRRLAMLRAIGAGRGQLRRALLTRGVLTGLVGGLGGVALASAGTFGVLALLRAGGLDVPMPGYPGPAAALCVLLAVLVTTAAVVAPARSAASVAPVEALRASAAVDSGRSLGTARMVFGVLALAIGGLLAVAPGGVFTVVLSGLTVFGGLVAFGPLVVSPLVGVLGVLPSRLGGVPGSLAVRNARRVPRRVAGTSIVVSLGVTLVTGLLIVIASLRRALGADSSPALARQLDVITAIGLVLLAMTVLIAVVGVAATLSLSVVERVAESGLLRALGLTRVGLRLSLAWEGGLIGAAGAVIGLALGLAYAVLMVTRIGLPAVAPPAQLLLVVASAVAFGVVAGMLPARRAAKVSPIEALNAEGALG